MTLKSGGTTFGISIRKTMRRIFAISDLHVDFKENKDFVFQWSQEKYGDDILLVAGDVTDSVSLLRETLSHLTNIFHKVLFVPGNHDLWIRRREEYKDSIVKFHDIISMCESIKVSTKPEQIQINDSESIWICPLFSWYSTPQDDPTYSLYMKPSNPRSDEIAKQLWMDNHLCHWPEINMSVSEYFEKYNRNQIPKDIRHPIITFSHFLPRQDLIFPDETDDQKVKVEQERLGLDQDKNSSGKSKANFNFTLYAGCNRIENQIRRLKSVIHVHGHQHRQRDRKIDNIIYISHCLGYKRERDGGLLWGLHEWAGPKQIWPICDTV